MSISNATWIFVFQRILLKYNFKEARIVSHKRLYGETGLYSTLTDHMPDNHRFYLEHTPEVNSREWAQSIGPHMEDFVKLYKKMNLRKRR